MENNITAERAIFQSITNKPTKSESEINDELCHLQEGRKASSRSCCLHCYSVNYFTTISFDMHYKWLI